MLRGKREARNDLQAEEAKRSKEHGGMETTQAKHIRMEYGIDRYGMDYKYLILVETNPRLCEKACRGENQCKAFTYVKPGIQSSHAVCWLKSGVPPQISNICCVSGVNRY
ncbi:MAG: PAN domain-containing protein [Candidatus Competibacteraceae bacterium]